jgi:hypothetical protein
MSAEAPEALPEVSDDDLLALLRAVDDADDGAGTVSNDVVGRSLGWAALVVSERLTVAKDRLLVWGVRVGGKSGPCYDDLELTVQGRRMLRVAASASASSPE